MGSACCSVRSPNLRLKREQIDLLYEETNHLVVSRLTASCPTHELQGRAVSSAFVACERNMNQRRSPGSPCSGRSAPMPECRAWSPCRSTSSTSVVVMARSSCSTTGVSEAILAAGMIPMSANVFKCCDFPLRNSPEQIVVAEDRLQVLRLIPRVPRKREIFP